METYIEVLNYSDTDILYSESTYLVDLDEQGYKIPHGKMTIYHRNGQVQYARNYFNDKFDGVQSNYNLDGELTERSNFKLGRSCGYSFRAFSSRNVNHRFILI